jgi:hypothetical protein
MKKSNLKSIISFRISQKEKEELDELIKLQKSNKSKFFRKRVNSILTQNKI